MIVVLDTNVLVAGLLSPSGPCGEIVRMVSSGDLRLCLDARIAREYQEVLARPRFGFDPERVRVLLAHVLGDAVVVPSRPLPTSLPDPDDEPFLQAALAGEAFCLVTGNARHFPETARQGIRVLSPADFLIQYRRTRGN